MSTVPVLPAFTAPAKETLSALRAIVFEVPLVVIGAVELTVIPSVAGTLKLMLPPPVMPETGPIVPALTVEVDRPPPVALRFISEFAPLLEAAIFVVDAVVMLIGIAPLTEPMPLVACSTILLAFNPP
jgi:hypothetical protein